MVKQNYKKYAFPALMILALIVLGVSMQSGLFAGEIDVSRTVYINGNLEQTTPIKYGDEIAISIRGLPAVLNYANMPVRIWGGDAGGLGAYPLYYAVVDASHLQIEISGDKLKYLDMKSTQLSADEKNCRLIGLASIAGVPPELVCEVHNFNPVLYGTGFLKSDIFTVDEQEILNFSFLNYLPAGNYTLEMHWIGTEGEMSGISAGGYSARGVDTTSLIRNARGGHGLYAKKNFVVLPSEISACPLGHVASGDGCAVGINAGEACLFGQTHVGNNCLYPLKNYVKIEEPINGDITYPPVGNTTYPPTNIQPSQPPPSTDVNIEDNLFAVALCLVVVVGLVYLIVARKK